MTAQSHFLGFCGLIGTILMYAAAYRALVKIDALQVQMPTGNPTLAVATSSE